MREIKFRGKDCSGKWRYGAYIPTEFTQWQEPSIFDGHHRAEVDGETLGQYTGCKDVYGEEIYEGDILEDMSENTVTYKRLRMIVRFGEFNALESGLQNLGFYVEIPKDKHTYIWSRSLKFWLEGDGVRVIGNVFDNPELLEEETCITN